MKNRILVSAIGIMILISLSTLIYAATETITEDEALVLADLINNREDFKLINEQLMNSAPYAVTSDPDVLQAFAEKLIEFKVSPTPDWIKRNANKLPADMQKELPDVELKAKTEKLGEDAASAESTASAVKYGGIGVVVLLIVLLVLMKGRYGSWKTLATPGGTSLGQQAAAEVRNNQEELDRLFAIKEELLRKYDHNAFNQNIAEVRKIL